MDPEESNKRKSIDLEEGEQVPGEPSPKQIKIDSESPSQEPNLQIETTDSANVVESQQKPSITITFHEDTLGDLYKPKFIAFLNHFVDLKTELQDNSITVYKDPDFQADDWVVVDEAAVHLHTAPETNSPKKPHDKKHSKAKKELFVVDASPSQNQHIDLRYNTTFTVDTEKPHVAKEKTGLQSCFNCGGSHSLKDCTEPKNFTKINEARQKFRTQQTKSVRYHLDEDQKYAHLTPGNITEQLKKALGLRKNELPHYVYLMRQMGYPPGWLEEAKYEHSNLDMFGVEGVETAVKIQGLDPKKVIDYVGFNVPPEKGTKDESRKYGVPAFCDDFRKEHMIKYFNEQHSKQSDILVPCSMELETPEKQPKPVELPEEELDESSLVELQKQKRKLLEELNDEPPPPDYLSVRTTCFGTPVLKSNSPYATLPNPDNFSKDVSPVINFENLPNSTGKYEQMIDVLQKVRDTLKTIQNCTDTSS